MAKAQGPLRKLATKAKVRFIKNHVETMLIRSGFSPDRANGMVADLTDAEVSEHLVTNKVGALGDGSILKWLTEHGPQIWSVIQALFSLLSLTKARQTAEGGEGEQDGGEGGEETPDENTNEGETSEEA